MCIVKELNELISLNQMLINFVADPGKKLFALENNNGMHEFEFEVKRVLGFG